MKNDYSHGIEVAVLALIVNDENKILLTKSHRWKDVYLVPGGHVEEGEKLIDAVKREGEEETSLKLKPLYCVSMGELIHDPNYHRKTHFIYFYFVCKALTSEIRLDEKELMNFIWVTPREALSFKLANGVNEAIENYINDIKINIKSSFFDSH